MRAYIARRAHLPADVIQVLAPRTPAQPRPIAGSGEKKGPTDLLKSTKQYRLDVQANPTVPVLDIYAQAPTASASTNLAQATFDGARDYLRDLAASQRTPPNLQVDLRQLGRATGHVINSGIQVQLAFVTFLLVFAVACGASIVIARVRRGWLRAAASEY